MLEASATTQLAIELGSIHRQLCVGAPYKGDYGRVETGELRDTIMYLLSFTLTYFFHLLGEYSLFSISGCPDY